MSTKKNCGTYAAYQQHVKRTEPVDDACRIARNAYMAEYRQKKPEVIRDQMRAAKFRNRALGRLADRHYEEFRRLLAWEYSKDEDES